MGVCPTKVLDRYQGVVLLEPRRFATHVRKAGSRKPAMSNPLGCSIIALAMSPHTGHLPYPAVCEGHLLRDGTQPVPTLVAGPNPGMLTRMMTGMMFRCRGQTLERDFARAGRPCPLARHIAPQHSAREPGPLSKEELFWPGLKRMYPSAMHVHTCTGRTSSVMHTPTHFSKLTWKAVGCGPLAPCGSGQIRSGTTWRNGPSRPRPDVRTGRENRLSRCRRLPDRLHHHRLDTTDTPSFKIYISKPTFSTSISSSFPCSTTSVLSRIWSGL